MENIQADAGLDGRTRLARPNSQARTGPWKYSRFPVRLTASRIGNLIRLIRTLAILRDNFPPEGVCVCVFFPFILDIKFVGRTSRGHTGGSHRIFHPPSFCGACLNFSREKDSAIPFPRRPRSRILGTDDLDTINRKVYIIDDLRASATGIELVQLAQNIGALTIPEIEHVS